jgi:hypothetical protein
MKKLLIGCLMVLFLAIPMICQAAGDLPPTSNSASLSWEPPAIGADTVTGYKLHWGTLPGSPINDIDVGNVLTFIITGLPYGTIYFVCTAYNSAGIESDYSNEVSKTFVPAKPGVPQRLKFNGALPAPGTK